MSQQLSAIVMLKKAHAAMSFSTWDSNLIDFIDENKDKTTKTAQMTIINMESKFVPQYLKKHEDSEGYRTVFTLADGTTVGTFSNAAFRFFQFFAQLMGHKEVPGYLSIAIDGTILVNLSIESLDGGKTTYNFELDEEGSTFHGLREDDMFSHLSTLALSGPAPIVEENTTEEPTEEPTEDPAPETTSKKK